MLPSNSPSPAGREAEENRFRLELMNAIARQALSEIPTDKIISGAVEKIGQRFPDYRAAYSVIDAIGRIHIVHSVEPPGMPPIAGLSVELSEYPGYLEALRKLTPLVIKDMEDDPRLSSLKRVLAECGIRAAVHVPINIRQELVGLLCLSAPVATEWCALEIETLKETAEFFSILMRKDRWKKQHGETEKALRRATLVVENSPAVLFRCKIDEGWPVDYVSRNVSQFGYTSEELVSGSVNYASLIHPEDLWRVGNEIRRFMAAGQDRFTQEYRIVTKSGGTRWVDDRTSLERDENGTIIAIQGIVLDITDRKTAQDDLFTQKEVFQKILDNIPVMVAFMNGEGTHRWVNRSWETTLGWKLEDVCKTDILAEFYPDSEQHQCAIDGILKAERKWTDFKTRTKDGRILDTSWFNLRLPDGSRVGIGQDMTEHKRAEEEHRLLEAQLMQAQKMESVGRLAGGVAHDFNNMLSAILGYAEILIEGLPASAPSYRRLNEILKAGERAKNLTRQLLAFGRKQVLEITTLNLNTMVLDFQKMLQRIIGEDVKLLTDLDESLGTAKADLSQLEQVLLNLSVNARDAMPNGGTLNIETANVYLDEEYASQHPGVKPGAYVMLAVSDTGFGMDEETRAQIFEPFFTTKVKGKGTGLGLAMVYGIVKQHGGNIWVYSEPDHGTTFKIYLPQVEEHLKAKDVPEADQLPQQSSETVLLIEDEDSVRSLTSEILQRQGYTVLEAALGQDAMEIAKTHPGKIDLVISDVIMPGMNGREVYRRIADVRPGIRVLYMSGYTENVIAHHGVLDAGVNFLQKPFSLKGFADKVRAVLDER